MKITDGIRMIEVEMKIWDKDSENWGCDMSNEYFGNFSDIRYDNEAGCESVALVHDLGETLDMLNDWESDADEDEERIVDTEDVTADTAENLACVMRHSGTWYEEQVAELCRMAGMEDEYRNSDDNAEDVVFRAAEKLDVNIDWDGQNL